MQKNLESSKSTFHSTFVAFSLFATFVLLFIVFVGAYGGTLYKYIRNVPASVVGATSSPASSTVLFQLPPKEEVQHVATPKQVKALYMSSWVASSENIRKNIVQIIDTTETNSIVIDIKDATGKISFVTEDAALNGIGCTENRIRDIKSFISSLHEKGIYVIGRVSVFQDPCFVQKRSDLAVRTGNAESIWKDRKGILWIDAGAQDAWKYNVQIARASYEMGFDEINFDYIRFPSDGNMNNISFPFSGTKQKRVVLGEFFQYLDKELHTQPIIISSVGTTTPQKYPPQKIKKDGREIDRPNITISADLFGMVTTNSDDLGIGQVLEYALPYLDYVAPMVYPSHFPATWNGIPNPAARPYDVIHYSMKKAGDRATAMGIDKKKLRPWIQDFNLGATYTAEMVRAQIQATYDVGLDSWMIWSPSNKYTKAALLTK